jgi:aminopeptidase N
VSGLSGTAGPPADPAGVTRARALERSGRVSSVSCALNLRVPDERASPIHGRITIRLSLKNARMPLVLDFDPDGGRLVATRVNGSPTDAALTNGHIVLPPDALVEGLNEVTFDFVAGAGPLNRRNDLLYSLFVPARASHVFPCFDQPDIKAAWDLALDVPRGWKAVSNGPESAHRSTDSCDIYRFDRTAPIPTYLFAFAVGRFTVDTVSRAGRTFRVFHLEPGTGRVARNLPAIVDQHAHALEWMEQYTQIPYPFGKFDIVLIPSMQFGGMEHPGAVFYNADLLLLDTSATQQQSLSRANVIAHETAHMWFGNLVTMTWFDDVWLKEVFASFMAAKMVNPSYPGMNHALRFLAQHYPAAYSVDRTAGAYPIRQPLDNLDDAGSLYGAVIYQKAPMVLRQLELLIGEEALQSGLRDYLSTHAFGNASWPDLLCILHGHTSQDLTVWSRAWIDEPGRPTLSVTAWKTPTGLTELRVHQRDPRDRGLVWPQHMQVLVGWATATRTFGVNTNEPTVSIRGVEDLAPPGWMLPGGAGLAYGAVELDRATIAFLTGHVHELGDELVRAAAYLALWDAMLDGQIAPAALFETQLTAIASESDELARQLLFDQVRQTFWRFTPASARGPAAARLEAVLRVGLRLAIGASAKATWFTTLRAVACTEATIEWLGFVWGRTQSIDDLTLAEADETALALDLAVRLPERAEAIIATQTTRIDQPERRNRLSFIAPFVSPDAATRSEAFQRLANPAGRTRETWVLDAMHCLHHPLRAEASTHLVRPALALLRDIQRTGDIFFPQRWADATLWGHQSRTASDEVRLFIDTLPDDYPPRLRRVLLTAADPLLRASKLLHG